jgi:plastocyanin
MSLKRAFLGRPADAFRIMREFGLGVTDVNLAKIAEPGGMDVDLALARRLSGRILLQVESRGEAWYVYPVDLKRYFLGRPEDAFSLMKKLGLGITDADLDKIPVHEKYAEPSALPPVVLPAVPPAAGGSAPVSRSIDVAITGSGFSPASVTIKAGDTVVWKNNDSVAHVVASNPHPVHTDLPGLYSGTLSPGLSYSFVFQKKGAWGYHCHVFPAMTGTIIVE